MQKKHQHHINMDGSEGLGKIAILPGDPGRVELIAKHLRDAHQITHNREYNTWVGTLPGEEGEADTLVTVTSTGIGCPSAAIATQELANLGVHTFIRLGTCGSLNDKVRLGHYIVTTGAVRRDGTTDMIVPPGYPPVSDHFVTAALIMAACKSNLTFHVGVTDTKDAFYCEGEAAPVPMAEKNEIAWLELQRAKVLGTSMEASAILSVAAINECRAGELLLTVGYTLKPKNVSTFDVIVEGYDIKPGIGIVLQAIRHLTREDKLLGRFQNAS